jgi:hypothetical protein
MNIFLAVCCIVAAMTALGASSAAAKTPQAADAGRPYHSVSLCAPANPGFGAQNGALFHP